jgi:IclR helix-turn-helix domain
LGYAGGGPGWWQTARITGDDVGADAAGPRPVIGGAFGLLASLHRLGSARVSQLQRDSGLPRTTVYRLLTQLEEVGAVERSAGHWRLGPTPVEYGAGVPAEPRLRSVARRPLMDLANAIGPGMRHAGDEAPPTPRGASCCPAVQDHGGDR